MKRLTKEQQDWCIIFTSSSKEAPELLKLLSGSEIRLLDKIRLHSERMKGLVDLDNEGRTYFPSKSDRELLSSIREKYITWVDVLKK